MSPEVVLTVSQFIAVCNQTLDYAYGDIVVEGEVASFRTNQGKWVFFDLKEGEASLGCFMVLSQMRFPLTDGMKVRVKATPNLTRWGKFSLVIKQVMPLGEGSIKKSFEMLKKKLAAEGLFDPAKKREIPRGLSRIGVISSTTAAGYIDFLKILQNRWGGMEIQTINTQVQGLNASEQIIRALAHFNQRAEVEAIVIVRGGGSADDLSAFNDEALTRAIAASRIPVMTGIGHEVDQSLADLAADVRASTPSNAAERLTYDRAEIVQHHRDMLAGAKRIILDKLERARLQLQDCLVNARHQTLQRIEQATRHVSETKKILQSLNPDVILSRGYAIMTGKVEIGKNIELTTINKTITAEVKNVQDRKTHH